MNLITNNIADLSIFHQGVSLFQNNMAQNDTNGNGDIDEGLYSRQL